MIKGKKTIYFCQNCGYEASKWMGQCPGCREWNTFVEETVSKSGKSDSVRMMGEEKKPVTLSGIPDETEIRMSSGIQELDRVLGGGIVNGSLVLVGGCLLYTSRCV